MALTSPLFVTALLSGLVSLVFGVLVVSRWHKPGADWYAVSVAGAACWTFGYAGGLLVFDPSLRWLFELPIWIGHGMVPVAFFVFVLHYTGRVESLAPSHHVLLWTVPVITVLAVLTNDVHNLMWSDYRLAPTADAAAVAYEKGPWLYVHKAYSYLVVAAGSVAVVMLFAARDSLYTKQALALIGVTGPLVAVSVAWLFGLGPYPQVDATPLLFGLVYAVTAVVLFKTSVFDSAPAARRIGKRRVIDDFDDGVLLLDDTDRIVDANPAAARIFEGGEGSLTGATITDVLPDRTPDIAPGRFTLRLETTAGYRTYEVTISTISGGRTATLGHSLVFHDVTDETQRRQRLSVLNRVIRHNLRNDLNVIQSYAAELETVVDPPRDELATVIVEQSKSLAALGEKARRLERLLDVPAGSPTTVSLASLLGSVVDRYDDASFTVTLDGRPLSLGAPSPVTSRADALTVSTYPTLLEAVLEDVIQNAVVHGGDPPIVTVDLERTSDGVTIIVTDNGPGIPELERTPIDAGTETPLEHASGLGLWLVTWGAARLGGSVSFTQPTAGGTRVRIDLPERLEGTNTPSSDAAGTR
ncbi:histidine kinase N-terminal 7TM domain-containing protein [Natronobiforma cellulositropha]|uniref:histidine kinase N-terminal 7TM domain-containing protein n=1 Tax=Natronobiforma cellulositropha TaxID=1679076 RepID=UPI0021D60BB3|nr:histidine kinase N-terminal 7TM domain-containing protein [Natronobiforma cellulositropha]